MKDSNKAKAKSTYNFMKKFVKESKKDRISECSAQCAYYTILSFIPFLILLITLIQYTGISPNSLYDAIAEVVPANMEEFVLSVVEEVYSKSIGTISLSAIITIWSAGRGLFALGRGIQIVYNTESNKSTSYISIRLKSLLGTIIFIVLIVAGMFILVFGNSFVSLVKEKFGGFQNFGTFLNIITKLAVYLVMFFVFLFLYKFMPKRKLTLKSQVPGAIFGAVALGIISFVFSKYLFIFKGFSLTYGSLTTLMLVMMWIYACFFAVFLGAEINKNISTSV